MRNKLGALVVLWTATTFLAVAQADEKVVRVFILAGQSNMEGHGKVEFGRNPAYQPDSKDVPREIQGGIGSLRHLATHPGTSAKYRHLLGPDGNWVTRDDVWVHTTTSGKEKGRLSVGFGKGNWFGPEFGFGHILGDRMEEPILLIKTAWGGHDLGVKFRSPSAGMPAYRNFKFRAEDVGSSYRKMMEIVRNLTRNLAEHFPELQGYQPVFSGFGWHQGWNDGSAEELTVEYESNLIHFIQDVRKDLGVPDLPFVIANTGQNGPATKGRFARLCQAQMDLGDPSKHPEFQGTVASVDTRPFHRPESESPSNFGYHWNHNAESHYLVGESMGLAMTRLLGLSAKPVADKQQAPPWVDPDYAKDIPATMAVSREGEPGWNLWIPHHEKRKKWVSEKPVDLLMVGDSIVFMWSRTGRKVWEEYYGKRNAVNIGSSGDRTQHMLWHFQNGGLEGLQKRNPKLVILMMGTNNRGEPEKHGQDTAYGVLALLKEIHHQLPESRILLLGIFPRGAKASDPGRIRNEEINQTLQTYADEKTVFWMDLQNVFLDENKNLKKELMPDGLHPNEAGYRAWAKAMEPFIQRHLGHAPE